MTEQFDPSKIKMVPVTEEEMRGKAEPEKIEKPRAKKTKRISYSKGRYSKVPVCKVVNKGIINGVNNSILKDKKKKLTKDDCEVGEALMYMVEYYSAIDVKHPALVMLSAVMGVTFSIIEYSQEDAKPKKRKDDVEPDEGEKA